jgi:hypothetical protein
MNAPFLSPIRDKKVDPEVFARMARHYSIREICEIVWVAATEHFYNITNIGMNIHSDMLCKIRPKTASSDSGSERASHAAA